MVNEKREQEFITGLQIVIHADEVLDAGKQFDIENERACITRRSRCTDQTVGRYFKYIDRKPSVRAAKRCMVPRIQLKAIRVGGVGLHAGENLAQIDPATGAIMTGTLLDELQRRGLTRGIVAASGAAGAGSALLLEIV